MSRSAAHADVATVAMTMGLEALEAQDGELWFRREKDAESPWMRVHPANGEGVVMSPVATASAAVEEVLRSREPTVLRQGSALEGGAGFEGDGEAGLLVGVPLSVAGRSLGAWVFRMEGKQLWTETDKAFALAIVHQGALALERARLYEDAQQLALTHQRWAQRSNLLADLGYEIAEATAEFPRLTLTIVQFLARRFQGAGFLRLLDDDGTRFGHVVAWHDDETLREKMRLAASVPSHPTVEESYASVWLNSEKPVWFPRLQEEVRQAWFPQECQPFLREVEPQDLLVAPLRCRGIIRGILGFFRLPGQPMLTEADRSLLEEIAARVAMTLDNARLLRAREEAVQLRDDFLSIAGHELKTPLTSLMLQAAALSKGARGDAERAKLAERADRMAVSGGRLAKLIDELLDVSRLGAGRFTLEREPLDLRIMVAECLDQMRDDIARSKCEVALTQAGEVQGAWDRARMLQVIGNLLSNALKYGPGRPIQVHLHGDPRCVRLSVRDHGIGIAVEDQARIFHRFERAVSPRHFGGLGLGLWIVRLVVEAHGGNIRVESLPQQGSRFEVTLPRTEEAKVHREEMRPWHATGSLEEHGSR
jgi:signal transduction histidine kinase